MTDTGHSGFSGAAYRIGTWLNRRSVLASGVAGLAAAAAVPPAHAKESGNIEIVKNIILAWRNLDVEAVLKYVADDIVWYAHVGGRDPIKGKAAMRAFITTLGAGISENTWRVFNMTASGDNVYCEGVDDFKLKDGTQVTVPYLGIIVLKNGLAVEWRDYFDGGMVDRMKKGEFDFANDGAAPLMNRLALF